MSVASLSAQQEPSSVDPELIADLVAANHILVAEGVLDGYGHVSVRHNRNPSHFFLASSLAPQLVTANDILEFDLDSTPVESTTRALYSERFIHSEIYKVRPDVKAIVHNHSPSVIPFGVSSVPLKALYHMAAFIGEGLPVFDIRNAGGLTDMLVRNSELAAALARSLGNQGAVLMRGHGAAVVGSSLPVVVGRSVYLEINARLQAQAMTIGGTITYLHPEEARKATDLDDYKRAWDLWKRKVVKK
ncbi:MAG: class II aldolase/adducin family protein [Acidobacteria bacterium]|nr:class II aldolase/adducin family protein [Acidobacteriota bacterium]